MRRLTPIVLVIGWLIAWGLGLLAESGNHASFWFPPSGLTFAVLLVAGRRAVVPLLVAAILSTFWATAAFDIPLSLFGTVRAGVYFGVAHILSYGVAAVVLRRIALRPGNNLPGTIIAFLLIAPVAALLATASGMFALVQAGMEDATAIGEMWLPFWIGDMVGVIVLAPLFAALANMLYPHSILRLDALSELNPNQALPPFVYKVLINVLFLAASMILTAETRAQESAFVIFFLIIPQMWITYTEGPTRTCISIAIISFLIVSVIHFSALSDFLMVYQFAVAVVAASSYFGLSVPVLNADNSNLRRQVFTDTLTRVSSREFLLGQFTIELQRCLRTGSNLAMIIFDIDHFKQINDDLGHVAGDRVLQQVGVAAKSVLRAVDILARYGGDEFVVLLPNTKLADAVTTAKRILRQVREVPISDGRPLSISLGVSEYQSGDDFPALFSRSDKLLYAAKKAGRNRVVATGLSDPQERLENG